jgi:hypothetical protein
MIAIFGGSTLPGSSAPEGSGRTRSSRTTHEVWRQFFDDLRQTESSRPMGLPPDPRLERLEGLWRDAPLAPVIRDATVNRRLVGTRVTTRTEEACGVLSGDGAWVTRSA